MRGFLLVTLSLLVISILISSAAADLCQLQSFRLWVSSTTSGSSLPSFTASPSFSPLVSTYTYSVTGDVVGRVTFGLSVLADQQTKSVQILQDGRLYWTFDSSVKRNLAGQFTTAVNQETCGNYTVVAIGPQCDSHTYTLTCTDGGSTDTTTTGQPCPTGIALSGGVALSPSFDASTTEYTCSNSFIGSTTVMSITHPGDSTVSRRRLMRFMEHGMHVFAVTTSTSLTFNQVLVPFVNDVSLPMTFVAGTNTIILSSGTNCPVYTISCDGEVDPYASTGATGGEVSSSTGGSGTNAAVVIGCTLDGLILGDAETLSPVFDSNTFNYTSSTTSSTFLSSLTASLSSASVGAGLTLTVNGASVDIVDDVQSATFVLNQGDNQIDVTVQGSACKNVYQVTATRLESSGFNDTNSTDGSATSFNWQLSAYGNCSGSCVDGVGVAGTFTRSVICISESGDVADDSECTQPKPATEAACTPTCQQTTDDGGDGTIVGDGNDAHATQAPIGVWVIPAVIGIITVMNAM